MSAEDPSAPKGFDERLRAARATQRERSEGKPGTALSGGVLGVGFRIGIELVAAIIVGVGIGWLLDWWLGTTPWLLVLFFLLGAAAGMSKAIRGAMKLGRYSGGRLGSCCPRAKAAGYCHVESMVEANCGP